MLDSVFNVIMAVFAFSMFGMAMWKQVHTGVLGSAGCTWLGIVAIVTIDDAAFNVLDQFLPVSFAIGALMIVAHVVLRVLSANRNIDDAQGTPHRRSSDWMGLRT